jgi:hypothetical protein
MVGPVVVQITAHEEDDPPGRRPRRRPATSSRCWSTTRTFCAASPDPGAGGSGSRNDRGARGSQGRADRGPQGYRSGYYDRRLVTRVRKLELRVPQDRGRRFPTELFERYQRSEKALVAAPPRVAADR